LIVFKSVFKQQFSRRASKLFGKTRRAMLNFTQNNLHITHLKGMMLRKF